MESKAERSEDQKLIRAAVKGDGQAWGRLVERHSPLVMAVLRTYRISPEDRADAFQYAFVELFRHLDGLQQVESLPAWLRVVVARHCQKLRSKQDRFVGEGGEAMLEQLASPESLDQSLLDAERDHLVRLGVARLSESCRQLIHALFYEDPPRSYQEVAEEMGLSVGSIGVTRQRCLQHLQRLLRAQGMD